MRNRFRILLIGWLFCSMATPLFSVAAEQKAPVLPWIKGAKCTLQNFTPECRDYLRLKQARLLLRQHGAVDPELMTYACDMRSVSAHCRTQSVLKKSVQTIAELEDGCTSMGGNFTSGVCPETGQIARCRDIVRNAHKPDVIYDNHYYPGAPAPDELRRICQNLGGHFGIEGQ